jgi:predicted component of viral defense system (DUF524 family)
VRTPRSLPRIQQESVVRLLGADLVDPAAVLEGLQPLRAELEAAAVSRERIPAFKHRAHLLDVNHRYARRFLELQLEWLDEAERALRGG